MTKLTLDEVKHIAKLSKLELTEEELVKFQNQLSSIVSYISELSEVETKDLEPTSQTTGLENVFRLDELKPNGLNQDEALSGSDKTHNGYFIVDALLDKES